MTYKNIIDNIYGCYEDANGNRPCDNGALCDRCLMHDKDMLTELMRYGEIIEDYNFEDKVKGYIRITKYKHMNEIYTVVMINGECISIGLEHLNKKGENLEMMNMSEKKKKALETLEKVKRIYDDEGGDLLCGGFWSEFMSLVNEQIKEINETCK